MASDISHHGNPVDKPSPQPAPRPLSRCCGGRPGTRPSHGRRRAAESRPWRSPSSKPGRCPDTRRPPSRAAAALPSSPAPSSPPASSPSARRPPSSSPPAPARPLCAAPSRFGAERGEKDAVEGVLSVEGQQRRQQRSSAAPARTAKRTSPTFLTTAINAARARRGSSSDSPTPTAPRCRPTSGPHDGIRHQGPHPLRQPVIADQSPAEIYSRGPRLDVTARRCTSPNARSAGPFAGSWGGVGRGPSVRRAGQHRVRRVLAHLQGSHSAVALLEESNTGSVRRSPSPSCASPARPFPRQPVPQPLVLDRVMARRLRSLAQAVGRQTGHDLDGSMSASPSCRRAPTKQRQRVPCRPTPRPTFSNTPCSARIAQVTGATGPDARTGGTRSPAGCRHRARRAAPAPAAYANRMPP